MFNFRTKPSTDKLFLKSLFSSEVFVSLSFSPFAIGVGFVCKMMSNNSTLLEYDDTLAL